MTRLNLKWAAPFFFAKKKKKMKNGFTFKGQQSFQISEMYFYSIFFAKKKKLKNGFTFKFQISENVFLFLN